MIHLLRAAGASLVLDARGAGAPVLVHWGRDLGPLDQDDLRALADAVIPAVTPSSIDRPLRIGVVPTLADGWSGSPGLDAHPAPAPARHVTTMDAGTDAAGGGVVDTVVVAGAHEVRLRFALSPQGVLEVDQRVRNVSDCANGAARGIRRPPRSRPRARGPRLRRTLGGRACAAATDPRIRHVAAGVAARPRRPRRGHAERRRNTGLRIRPRGGVGDPRGVERRHRVVVRALRDGRERHRGGGAGSSTSRWRRAKPTRRPRSWPSGRPTGSMGSRLVCTPGSGRG